MMSIGDAQVIGRIIIKHM